MDTQNKTRNQLPMTNNYENIVNLLAPGHQISTVHHDNQTVQFSFDDSNKPV